MTDTPPLCRQKIPAFSELYRRHNHISYRAPLDIRVSHTPLRRALIIGSCLSRGLPSVIAQHFSDPCPCDFVLFNNLARLPPEPPGGITAHDIHLIQIPLRQVLPDRSYFHLSYADIESWQRLFEESVDRISHMLSSALTWSQSAAIPAVVAGFIVPQMNPMGRLFSRYELSNPVHFVERLNEALHSALSRYSNTHFLDLDQIVNSFGKRFFLDDGVLQVNHAAALANSSYDVNGRIEPIPTLLEHYEIRIPEIASAMWSEIVAMYRTLRQTDQVKMIVVDLDDTLWRGTIADKPTQGAEMLEGWPLGLAEALLWLKKRGALLGIISKNDHDIIKQKWHLVFQGRLLLNDFAFIKINWGSKSANMNDILNAAHLLPRSVIFVDDNPREREEMQRVYPDMRVLGKHPYYLRRILLWSPETQIQGLTKESSRRTEMMQAQAHREQERKILSRDAFLSGLQVKVYVDRLSISQHARFLRAVELLNKTNQFNTTGHHPSAAECKAALANGDVFYVFDVEDKHTSYGLVGVVWVQRSRILQWVMSCRVIGLDVELTVMAYIVDDLRKAGITQILANLTTTDTNFPCSDLFSRCGFVKLGTGDWCLYPTRRGGASVDQSGPANH